MDGVRVVVGCGWWGFSTAVCIAENLPHVSVTLLGEKFSPETTSDGAAGILFANHNPDVPVEQQRRWFKSSFDHLRLIAQSEDAPEAGVMLSSGIMTEREMVRFPEHRFGQAFTTIKCECTRYLPWLEKRFRRAGGQVEQRRVDNIQDLSGSFDVIVNCSGLGSRSLAADVSVQPVRGQVLKMEAPWLQHFIRDGTASRTSTRDPGGHYRRNSAGGRLEPAGG
ncbi:D-aspartate oxidase [Dissostichus eleginoides]|uniref:D-aspartate oxidase n=1 Tax=Dissostichus eleginoides TaxID=100907 RepID=A0AAD9C2I3_DISEL|nr:D-aspartate oxidase [Dissostichus eleginoides]